MYSGRGIKNSLLDCFEFRPGKLNMTSAIENANQVQGGGQRLARLSAGGWVNFMQIDLMQKPCSGSNCQTYDSIVEGKGIGTGTVIFQQSVIQFSTKIYQV